MDNPEIKYRKDTLSPAELDQLRKKVNTMSDDELGKQMYRSWMEEDLDCSSVDDRRIKEIKNKIDVVIDRKRSIISTLIRVGQIAAVLLLPVFIILSIYFYKENNRISSEEMIVSTGRGERANITLPDGTSVILNFNSQLAYMPQTYNREERVIQFKGEAYFQVAKNKTVPFIINAKGLKVHVLGTIFNLSVRENSSTAELALEEGSVRLSSVKTNSQVVLCPLQKAILDQNTGDITVVSDNNIKDISAWKEGNMVFRNAALFEVLRKIEENYHVKIEINCKDCLTDKFTGTLPVNNLNEALEVLKKSYHLQAEAKNKIILLKPE